MSIEDIFGEFVERIQVLRERENMLSIPMSIESGFDEEADAEAWAEAERRVCEAKERDRQLGESFRPQLRLVYSRDSSEMQP